MASERRSYTKIPNAALTDPMDNETLGTLVRLQLYLSQRWAVGKLSAVDAGEAFLDAPEMMQITRLRSATRARRALLTLATRASAARLAIAPRASGVVVSWAAFVEYQGFESQEKARKSGESPPKLAPSATASATASAIREEPEGANAPQAATAAAPGPAAVVVAAPVRRTRRKSERVPMPPDFPPPDLRADLAAEFSDLELDAALDEFRTYAERERATYKGDRGWALALRGALLRDRARGLFRLTRDRPGQRTFGEMKREATVEAARGAFEDLTEDLSWTQRRKRLSASSS